MKREVLEEARSVSLNDDNALKQTILVEKIGSPDKRCK